MKRKNSALPVAVIAMLAALAYALRWLEVPLFLSPPWLKLDFSTIPALFGSFLYGPFAGILIDAIKEGFHIFTGSSQGIGELANFIMESALIVPASLFYRHAKFKGRTVVGCAIGCVLMGAAGALLNYFVLFPLYARLFMPLDAILGAYQAIIPYIDELWQAALIHVLPFNIVKGIVLSIVTVFLVKALRLVLEKYTVRKEKRKQDPPQTYPERTGARSAYVNRKQKD